MNCKTCGKEIHHCDSCEAIDKWIDLGYCSSACMQESQEYKNAIKNCKEFLDSLDTKQLINLDKLTKNEYVSEGEGSTMLRDILKEKLSKSSTDDPYVLKECPFPECRSRAELDQTIAGYWKIKCSRCGASVAGETVEDAIIKWNTRGYNGDKTLGC
jgi:hypothetical protein